jgi:glycosyltransferase involved in cell wall biosynthesis
MIVLTTTYNCEQYIEKCLFTIMTQKFKDFKCYITDDISTDNTVSIIKKTIQGDDRFVLIENQNKMYQPGNYDQIIRWRSIPGEEICVEVDGDDWLSDSGVFTRINEVYQDENVWMTSGSFKNTRGMTGFASKPASFENIRKQTFTLSHLRTWKSWLWKKIKEEDLKDKNGEYWKVAGDLAFMFPMFEMSGEEHYRFLTDINYVYNETNPISDHKVDLNSTIVLANKIRSKTPYTKL